MAARQTMSGMRIGGPVTVAPVTLTAGATVATDASLSTHFRLTPASAFTLSNPTNAADGQKITWEIIQDTTGSRVMTLGSAFAYGTDITSSLVVLTTTANKRDFLSVVYNASSGLFYVVGFLKGY